MKKICSKCGKEYEDNIITKVNPIPETPKTEFSSLEAQEKDNKEWFKQAVAEIQACKNVIVLKDWAQRNSIKIKSLLTELREALEVYYKSQWDKIRIGNQIKYRFL